ncbi:TetR/AcrR family transcriptional regulator [Hamadaea tsunoensis]|uniref:TetR/AcrR family transcriptional regulator n=1 Tax=Hamadaea tsunoensis TaxID=53368 RepID=UPI0004183674|nr:TetR/AcrR family transcriptional regulator [Hamadaea tsunoensis]
MGEDRRVRRTRRDLAEALVGLVLERGYTRVTVQDILDRADVGRSTFYSHFRDKEALLLSCFDGLRESLAAELAAVDPGRPPADHRRPSLVVFEHAYAHRRMYEAMCGRPGGTVVYGHLHRMIADGVRVHLAARPGVGAVPVEVVAEFYAAALLGLLTWWIGTDFAGGPDHVAALFGALASPGVAGATAAPEAALVATSGRT